MISDQWFQLRAELRVSVSSVEVEVDDAPVMDFTASWSTFGSRFPLLRSFLGGLASAFANTATVESDFSLISQTKTGQRSRIGAVPLEGSLHCRQMEELLGL